MKLTKTYAFILLAVLFVFASCKKEEVTTPENNDTNNTEQVIAEPAGDTGGTGDGDGEEGPGADDADVIVYGASWCSACTYLKGQLDDEEVDYMEKDVDEPEISSECYNAILDAGYTVDGSYSIPVAKVGDNPVLYGADCTIENILDQL